MKRGFAASQRSGGFTLIELLVVIAILGVLAVAVVLVLNPAALLQQARDSTRLSDLASLNTALSIFQADQYDQNLGTASTTYISVPDTSPTCADLGLPSLPSGWSYHCVPATSSTLVNGQGWIPVNFNLISSGSPLSRLPVDPINTTSTGLYYTYTPGGSYELTALPESQKYRSQYDSTPSLQAFPGVIAQGSDLSLSPLYNASGLVGWWPLDGNANDMSGNGNNGTLINNPTYVAGKIGQALSFNGSSNYVTIPKIPAIAQQFTISIWANRMGNGSHASGSCLFSIDGTSWSTTGGFLFYDNDSGIVSARIRNQSANVETGANVIINAVNGTWEHYVAVWNYPTLTTYLNGALANSMTWNYNVGWNTYNTQIGDWNSGNWFAQYFIDDVRIYNRALSAAEVQALYNAGE